MSDTSKPPFDSLEAFERQFRDRFGRDMTPEERRLDSLTKDLLETPPGKQKREDGSEAA